MRTPDKKFFSIEVYPKDKKVDKPWFVKYFVKDYTKGKLVPKKLTGNINKLKTLEEKEAESKKIVQSLESGYEPKNRGGRHVKPDYLSSNFADMIANFHIINKELSYKVSDKTFNHYVSKINTFHRWANETGRVNFPIGKIDKSDVREFIVWMKELKLAPKTINDTKTLMGTLFEEAIDKFDLNKKNPFTSVKGLPLVTNHFRPFPLNLRLLIAQEMPKYDSSLYTYMMTIFYTFARCNEIRNLKRGNIDFFENEIIIIANDSKSNKEKLCVMPVGLRQLLVDFGVDKLQPDELVFSQMDGQIYSYHHFRKRWNAFKKIHQIPGIYKMYGMKHTGNKLCAKYFNAPVLQKQNGHSSLQHTQNYIDSVGTDMENFINNFPSFIE